MCVENWIVYSYPKGRSCSAKGMLLDNSPIESFYVNLKKEEVYAKFIVVFTILIFMIQKVSLTVCFQG